MNRQGGEPGKKIRNNRENYWLASSPRRFFRAAIFLCVVSDGLALS